MESKLYCYTQWPNKRSLIITVCTLSLWVHTKNIIAFIPIRSNA